MQQPVLAAIDLSPASVDVVRWAADAATRFDARLVVLHVVHDPGSVEVYGHQVPKNAKHVRRLQDKASDKLSEFLARVDADGIGNNGNIEHRLVTGLPASRILEVADQIDAQMIVMGSHGRTGLQRLLLGSKAEKVAQLSPIPVTIVKNGSRN